MSANQEINPNDGVGSDRTDTLMRFPSTVYFMKANESAVPLQVESPMTNDPSTTPAAV